MKEFIIDDEEKVKRKLDMLNALSAMKITKNLISNSND